MQTRTICCKLSVSSQEDTALEETSKQFAAGCNLALQYAIQHKINSVVPLHKLCYAEIRKQCGLSANLTCQALRRVCATLKKLKGRRKTPRAFRPGSISYDARIFYCNTEKETVSLRTLDKRLVIPFVSGDFQKGALTGKNPTYATVIKKGAVWYIHLSVPFEVEKVSGEEIMGIDLGIRNTVTTSTDMQISGAKRQKLKAKFSKIRASLQSKGTRGCKKVLKRISGREHRQIRQENHTLAKQIIEEARRHDCGVIRMEQLKGIRERTKTWNPHRNRMVAGWSFSQLQKFVEYKASAIGIRVEYVDPHYSSQTCSRCFRLGSRQRELFYCLTCGESDADLNAAYVIAKGGAACKPARISAAR